MPRFDPRSLVWILAIIGCNRSAENTSAPITPTPTGSTTTPIVSIVQPVRATIQRTVEQPGTIYPFEETELFARVPGHVQIIRTDIGKRVKGPKFDSSGQEREPGELLAELAVPELDEDVKQNVALIAQADAEVEQAKRLLASADAHVTLIEANAKEVSASIGRADALVERWQAEVKRIGGLVQSGVIDAQTHDETINQHKAALALREETLARVTSASAAVKKAIAERERASADVRASEAKANVARAAAGRVLAMRNFARIRAPFDGVITHRFISTGDLVQPTNTKNEPLFTIAKFDPLRIVIAVPEADAGLVRDGGKVQLAISHGAPIDATITRTSWSLDPNSRTLRAEVDLPNADERYRPGMYVYARISGVLPESWTLPMSAIIKQGDASICFRIVDGKAVRTAVQVGRNDGKVAQVVRWQQVDGTWHDWSGQESIASKATGLSDGAIISAAGK